MTAAVIRTLVTGAGGFIGRHLCRALKARGHIVHAVTHNVCDVTNGERMRTIVGDARPNVVFHLAGLVGRDAESAPPPEPFRTNVEGVKSTLAACAGIGRFVLLSSASVGASVRGRYAQSKADAEGLLRDAAQRDIESTVALRVSTCYGPGDTSDRLVPYVLRQVVRRRPVRLTDGAARRDYIPVADAALAIAAAGVTSHRPPQPVLDLGSGTCLAVRDMAIHAARAARTDGETYLRFGSVEQPATEPAELNADPSLLRAWLPDLPRTPLDVALAQAADWTRRSLAKSSA